MEYVNVGKSGLKVSRLTLGCMTYGKSGGEHTHDAWTLDEAQSRPFIQRALDLGINCFDTADYYAHGKSEEVLGRALKDFARREEVVIATKVYFPIFKGPNGGGLSRKHIFEAVDASLRRLGTDYIDLYQIHRWDYQTPIAETMEALHDLVKAGKVLYLGASSMHAWQFSKAQYTAQLNGWTRLVSMQPQYNLVYREEEREMLPLCNDMGVGVLPWSPLARGFLAGNGGDRARNTARADGDKVAQRFYYQDADFAVAERLREVASDRGLPSMQLALAWVLARPEITSPIVGASKMQHLEDAVAALEIELSTEDLARLEEVYQPHRVLGHQ
ncbi:MAG: aldo/keto reductase [Haliea sp.]|uniref:aldo/keto reductase n=1 Tax=Haliea sp. TaxID=1932666 RepID=UPI0032EB3554